MQQGGNIPEDGQRQGLWSQQEGATRQIGQGGEDFPLLQGDERSTGESVRCSTARTAKLSI